MSPYRSDKRLQEIQHMLMEMASGNFFYRVRTSSANDNVEALSIVLNMLAEEIQESFYHQGFVNNQNTTTHLIQMSFLLDQSGRIQMVNQKACSVLSRLCNTMVQKPFEDLLCDKSKEIWKNKWKTFCKRKVYDTIMELRFITHENLTIPNRCYVTSFVNPDSGDLSVLVNVIQTTMGKNTGLDKKDYQLPSKGSMKEPKKSKVRLSYDDIRKIRQGKDMILNNLEMDPPHLKDLAHQLGTNEFKLKYGFKELYGTTVHKFLVRERLRKAKTMVQYTQLPFKTIGKMVGFKSFPHFSWAFKERYGDSPRYYRAKMKREEVT
ncbi:helix-turn-helix domain-containing protein [Euzebyella marina]|uniref:Helix-turn-helix domain-containing protein n=1 Tax=Euzebyella marina TaxID=1761453 RepID=A0A3G2L5M0_9FLAO|nr:helix-turn-helix domain-containing protein [Euzebyella marina]AYN67533.1 helix-turn-helix domain-containing protein [Euzebyella marina]